MEFSQEMLIDVGLNAAGYLIAALLGITIYSIFKRKQPAQIPAAVAETATTAATPSTNKTEEYKATVPSETRSRDANFIQFGGAQTQPTTNPTPGSSQRRDRSDIIRIAQQMLAAGAGSDKIRKVLPISEAELSLLQLSKKI